MRKTIPISVKKRCLEMKASGCTSTEIYEQYYKNAVSNPCSARSLQRYMELWQKRLCPDEITLEGGTYEGFTAHGATVQVNAQGDIVQAWIKQHTDEFDPIEFVEALKGNVERYEYRATEKRAYTNMLEIPLFDMHWGVNDFGYYMPVLDQLCSIIRSRYWKEIYIPFGQDFFHNDSIVKGETTKGTAIEKVDMVKAVKDGKKFMCTIIEEAIDRADRVKVVYSPGNHDKSISWMFMQMLLERYGEEVIDDSITPRRAFTFGKNAVMITHGSSKNANPKNLAHIFPVEFPKEFAEATTREVHAGHLHGEGGSDIFGVMVRRLSTGSKTDEWSDNEDYVGNHKRFMLFEWSLDGLRTVYYI